MQTTRLHNVFADDRKLPEHISASVYRAESDGLDLIYSDFSQPEFRIKLSYEGSFAGRVVAERKPMTIELAHNDQYFRPKLLFSKYEIQAAYFVPVIVGEQAVAAVCFFSSEADAFNDEITEVLRSVSDAVAGFFALERIGDPEFILPEHGLFVPQNDEDVRLAVVDASDSLLRFLAADPNSVHSLTPRKFEELVARILSDLGYDVVLTPTQKDGGYDVLAEMTLPTGRILTLVECKKWSPDNPVSVEVVRQLYGIVNARNATHGMIATTSRFTRDAIACQDAIQFHLALRDFSHLTDWLTRYE